MNLILLSLLTLSGTSGSTMQASASDYSTCQDCDAGAAGYVGHHLAHKIAKPLHGGCMGPTPQTCYNPPYGCYHGSRWNHRATAFSGTFYRKAYNYRNYFDYPWHAELHEPTSQFSFAVTGDAGEAMPSPPAPMLEKQAPPPPLPTPASFHGEVRAALHPASAPKSSPANQLRTLRR